VTKLETQLKKLQQEVQAKVAEALVNQDDEHKAALAEKDAVLAKTVELEQVQCVAQAQTAIQNVIKMSQEAIQARLVDVEEWKAKAGEWQGKEGEWHAKEMNLKEGHAAALAEQQAQVAIVQEKSESLAKQLDEMKAAHGSSESRAAVAEADVQGLRAKLDETLGKHEASAFAEAQASAVAERVGAEGSSASARVGELESQVQSLTVQQA
jgi:hypothetical protein